MKLTALFLLFLSTSYAQTETFDALLESGKAEFAKDFDQQDYSSAVEYLEMAVELMPKNTEALYYLGYAYSRLNSKDGNSMINMRRDLTQACSEQFEKINTLSPKYEGEFLLLDPYSKITAEWGSLALCYLYHNKSDSALWAFQEGKRRGGFGAFILEANRKVLETCSKDAILIASGDNFTIPLWYLQQVEGLRTDVAVVNVDMLSTLWYPAFLTKQQIVAFDASDAELETWQYTEWTDSLITIEDFTWLLESGFYAHYLTRGEMIFLSLLKANKFQRDLFFTTAFYEPNRLSLGDYLSSRVHVDLLNHTNAPALTLDEFTTLFQEQLGLGHLLNRNSSGEMMLYDNFRLILLRQVAAYISEQETKKAKVLMALLDTYGNEEKLPYSIDSYRVYLDDLRSKLK